MGAFLSQPKTAKSTHTEGEGGNLHVAISSMQGWRVDMEDAHALKLGDVDGKPDYSFFAVFDGHGGALAAEHSAKRMLARIVASAAWKEDSASPAGIGKAMVHSFLGMDDELRALPAMGDDHSGSTAVAAFVTSTHVIVANCGDSRSILVRGSAAVEMSHDHKPTLEKEKARIEAAGGYVEFARVNGDLAVSRALGDFGFKTRPDLTPEAQQVSAEADVIVVERDAAADQFLVLACDGIWDVMTNQDAASFLTARSPGNKHELGVTAEAMLDECLNRGSRDNMSVVLVSFPAGRPHAAAAGAAAPAAGGTAHAAPATPEAAAHAPASVDTAGAVEAVFATAVPSDTAP